MCFHAGIAADARTAMTLSATSKAAIAYPASPPSI
jgi:hypothetical protein